MAAESLPDRKGATLRFLAFWVLAAAISWTAYHFAASKGVEAETVGLLLADPAKLLAKFGPSIAGLIILAFSSRAARASFQACLGQTGGLLALVAAVLVPGALTVAGLALAAATDDGDVAALWTNFSILGAAGWILLKTCLGGGLGEELGLRGVALPLLLSRFGPRFASLVLGLFWTAWHGPALFGKPIVIWIAQVILTVSVSLILTFAWRRFGAALPFAILFHGALNGWAAYASASWAPTLEAMDIWQVARLLILLLIALMLLPLRWEPKPQAGLR